MESEDDKNSPSETVEDGTEVKLEENLQPKEDQDVYTKDRQTEPTELTPKVILPPVQLNTIQISVYPWQCLLPQLYHVPVNSSHQKETYDVNVSSHGGQSTTNELTKMDRNENPGSMSLVGGEGANHGIGGDRKLENKTSVTSGPNTRKRARSTSFSSQDEGKLPAKIPVSSMARI